MRRLKYVVAWTQPLTAVRSEGNNHIGVYAIHASQIGVDVATEFKPRFLLSPKPVSEPTPSKSGSAAAAGHIDTAATGATSRSLLLDVDCEGGVTSVWIDF